MPVIELAGVRKNFAGRVALDGVDLAVEVGESVGLLGPNGAGKTTLISLIAGLRRPDAGEIRLLGGSPLDPRRRQGLGVTPQATSVPGALRVREVVDLVGGHYVRPVPTDELLEQFGLSGVRDRQCGGLSGGQQRRLMVALALVGRPALAVLDEPTTGLDVEGRDVLWSQLRQSAERGSALLVTSHYLPDVEALTERVVVLNHGRVIADDHVGAIRARANLSRLRFRTPRDQGSDAALRALPAVVAVAWPEGTSPGAERSYLSWRQVEVSSHDSDATVRGLVNACVDFAELEISSATLEEAFRLLVAPGAERPLATATGAVTK